MNRFLTFLAIIAATFPVLAPAQAKDVKVAAVSFHPRDMDYNLPKLVEIASEAARNGAKLIVFPEMASTGYLYPGVAQLGPNFDTLPGKATAALGKVAREHDTYVAFGLIEKDTETGIFYNSSALVGPNGLVGKYRKNQLAVGDDNIFRAPGNLGFPVFDTAIGKIALLICYDDSQLQSLLLPALRGADIIAYSVAALHKPRSQAGSNINHTTIGSMGTLPGWIGVNVIGSDTSGVDMLGRDLDLVAPGASMVWDAQGRVLAASEVSTLADPKPTQTIYATLDVGKSNPQREFWLKHRRPELYTDYNFYRPVHDSNVDAAPSQVAALLVQYAPKAGGVEHNARTIDRLIGETWPGYNLVVLPFNALVGNAVLTKESVAKLAEPLGGTSYKAAASLARKYKTWLLFSMPEVADGKYHETAILFDEQGRQAGLYRKSHLNDAEKAWATPGNMLPVFQTPFGRIGVVLNDEARIPEVTEIYELKRADMLLVPVAYNQKDYGGDVALPRKLVPDESNRGMFIWYSMAKQSQAYTLVANFTGGDHADVGQSALYSLVPEEGFSPPMIAPRDAETAFLVSFVTNQNTKLWTRQQDKIVERRWDLALPLTLDPASSCLAEWRANPTSPLVCKGQY